MNAGKVVFAMFRILSQCWFCQLPLRILWSLAKMIRSICRFFGVKSHRLWFGEIIFVLSLAGGILSNYYWRKAAGSFFAVASLAGWFQLLANMVGVDGIGPYILAFWWFVHNDFLSRFLWIFVIFICGFCHCGAWLYHDRGLDPLLSRSHQLLRCVNLSGTNLEVSAGQQHSTCMLSHPGFQGACRG